MKVNVSEPTVVIDPVSSNNNIRCFKKCYVKLVIMAKFFIPTAVLLCAGLVALVQAEADGPHLHALPVAPGPYAPRPYAPPPPPPVYAPAPAPAYAPAPYAPPPPPPRAYGPVYEEPARPFTYEVSYLKCLALKSPSAKTFCP